MSTSKSRKLGAHFLWTLMLFTSFFPSPAYARSIFFEDDSSVMNTTTQNSNGGSVAAKNVEMGTGNVSFHESLFSVEGYKAFLTYNSEGVQNKASTWNLEQKQGVIGLGWTYPENKVIRLTQQTGNTEDDTFLLYNEGNTYSLLFISETNGVKEYRIAKQSDWVIKHILDQDQWQFFHPDGNIYIYGDGNFTITPKKTEIPELGNLVKHRSNSVEYNVKWDNWIGSSVIPDNQSCVPVAYNLSAIEDIYGEQVQLTYMQEEEQVGSATNSKRHTRATYLKEVKGLRNKTIRFTYADKTSNEYQDPHTEHQNMIDGEVDLTNDQDAYQERYERKYISKIGLYNRGGDLQKEVVLGYEFLKEGTALQKRMLTSINYNDSREDRYKPATVFDYFGLKQNEDGTSIDGVNANLTATGTNLYNPNTGALYGALKQQTLPDGISYGYHYGKQQINGASKNIPITFPDRIQNPEYPDAERVPWTAPQLFYGTDYVVAIFESMDISNRKSYVKVYQWIGDRWIEDDKGVFDDYFYDNYRAKDGYTQSIWKSIKEDLGRFIGRIVPLSEAFNALNNAVTDASKTIYRVGDDLIAKKNVKKAIKDWFDGTGQLIKDVALDVLSSLETYFENIFGGNSFIANLKRLYEKRTKDQEKFPRKVYHITMEKDFFALTRSLGGSQIDIFRKNTLVPGQWDLSREVAKITSKFFTMDSGDNFVVVLDELTDFMYIYSWDGLIWNTDFTVLKSDFDELIETRTHLVEDQLNDVFNLGGETELQKAQHRSAITAKNNMILAVITDSYGVNADITIFHHDENMKWNQSNKQVNKKAKVAAGLAQKENEPDEAYSSKIQRLGELLGRDGNIDVDLGNSFAVLQTYSNLDENKYPTISDAPIFGDLLAGLTPDINKINSTYAIVWSEDYSKISLQHLHSAFGQEGINTFIVGDVINKVGQSHSLLVPNLSDVPANGKNYAFRYVGNKEFYGKEISSPYYTSSFGNDVTSALVEDTDKTYKTPEFYQFNPNALGTRENAWSLISNASTEQIPTSEFVLQAINTSSETLNVAIQVATLVIPIAGELAGVAEETMSVINEASNVAGFASSLVGPIAKEIAKDIIGTNHKSTSIANNFISTNGKLFNRQPNGIWENVTDDIFTLDNTTTLVGGTNGIKDNFIPYTLKTPAGLKNYVKQLHNGEVYKSVELPFYDRVVHQDSLSATVGRGAYVSYGPVEANGYVTKNPFLTRVHPTIGATAKIRNSRPSYREASNVTLHKVAGRNLNETTLYDYPVVKVSIKQGNESLGYHHYRYGTDGIAYDSGSGIAFYGKTTDIPSSTDHPVNEAIALEETDDGYITHYYYNRYNAYGKDGINITGYPSQPEVQRISEDQLVRYDSKYKEDYHKGFDNGNINVLQGHPYATIVYNKNQEAVSRDYTYYKVFEHDILERTGEGASLGITKNYQVRPIENVHVLDGVIHRTVKDYKFIHHGLRMRNKVIKGTSPNGEEELHKTSYVYVSEVNEDVLLSNRLTERLSKTETTQIGGNAEVIKKLDYTDYGSFMVNEKELSLPKTMYKLANEKEDIKELYTSKVSLPAANLLAQETLAENYELDFIRLNPNSPKTVQAGVALQNSFSESFESIKTLQEGLDQYRRRLEAYMLEFTTNKTRTDQLNREILDLKEVVSSLREQINVNSRSISSTYRDWGRYRRENFPKVFIPFYGIYVAVEYAAQIKRYENQIKNLKESIVEFQGDIDQKNIEIREKQEEIESLVNNNAPDKTKVENTLTLFRGIDNAYSTFSNKLEKINSNSLNVLHSGELEPSVYQNVINLISQDVSVISGYVTALESLSNTNLPNLLTSSDLRSNISSITNQITQLRSRLTSLSSHHNDVKTNVETLIERSERNPYNWIATKTITKRDEKSGIAVAWKDADELDHSMLMDSDNEKPIATFRGENVYSSNATTKYYHFDDFGNSDSLGGTVVLGGHSGEFSATFGNRTIRPLGSVLSLTDAPDARHVVSGWIKNNVGASNATLTIVKDGDDDLFTATNTWQYFESILAIGEVPLLQTTNGLLIDDLLIRPIPVQVTMTSYDNNDLPALTINNNGRAIRHIYDDAQIPIAAIDDEGRVTGLGRHYYSREHLNRVNDVLRFEPTESYVNNLPNSNLNIGVQDEGLYLGDKQEIPTNFIQEEDNYVISFTAPDDFKLNIHGYSIEYNTQNNAFRILEGNRDLINVLYQPTIVNIILL
ncbi:coiled-coil domain-containing protein [Tenacibaculum amylolyticum]|uniref:hypothetical protein n=1 Tax=Tenacibaculum amylolyticum TaxID=104269 RepID=UPI0038932932